MATIGGELGELSEADRQLATRVYYEYYKLKQVVQQNEALSAKNKGLVEAVEDMRKEIQRLAATTLRCKKKKKVLKRVLHEAKEDNHRWGKYYNRLEKGPCCNPAGPGYSGCGARIFPK